MVGKRAIIVALMLSGLTGCKSVTSGAGEKAIRRLMAIRTLGELKDAKATAIGIASTPTGERDKDGLSVKAAYTLIRSAVTSVQQRSGAPRPPSRH